MEERIAKLEQIIHRLFCCSTSQFTGPQGPQGPIGIGIQGPPGAQGAAGPAGLNWQGEWVPCAVYNQDDAVAYNGASYFVTCPTSEMPACYSYNVTGTGTHAYTDCEGNSQSVTVDGMSHYVICSLDPISSPIGSMNFAPVTTTSCCTPPDLNPCFALLASQGAVGPQGPTGDYGNDGSNSGRWMYSGIQPGVLNPGSTWFTTTSDEFDIIDRICISYDDVNSADFSNWWITLKDYTTAYNPLVFIQITEVGANEIVGIYKLEPNVPPATADITLHTGFVELGVQVISSSETTLTSDKVYTISWVIQGGISPANAPKTIGTIPVLIPGPGVTLPIAQYDFNFIEAFTEPVGLNYSAGGVRLPSGITIGQTLVLIATGTYPYTIYTSDTSSILFAKYSNMVLSLDVEPYESARFTWDGKEWIMESINGIAYSFNNIGEPQLSLRDTRFAIKESDTDSFTTTPPSLSWLNSNYPNTVYPIGFKIYMPNLVGGGKVYSKIQPSVWAVNPINIVT